MNYLYKYLELFTVHRHAFNGLKPHQLGTMVRVFFLTFFTALLRTAGRNAIEWEIKLTKSPRLVTLDIKTHEVL